MFVSELDIEEFRGIKKCEEPIKLSKFVIIVGRNNSGKSAILEALSLLPDPLYEQYPWGKEKRLFLGNLHGNLHRGVSSLIYGYLGTAKIRYLLIKKIHFLK